GDAGGVVEGRAGAASPGRQRPTFDDLNDPVFRARMKARAKAAKKAAAANSGGAEKLEEKSHQARWMGEPGCGQKQSGGGDGERRLGDGGWMSSRRRDWCLDDVHFPATSKSGGGAGGGGGGGGGGCGGNGAKSRSSPASTSSRRRRRRRLSRSEPAPPSPPPPPALPTPPVDAGNEQLGAGATAPGAARAAAAAADPHSGRCTKRGAARGGGIGGNGGNGGNGDGVGGGDRPRRQDGVGPRSHAKKKIRGGGEGGGKDAPVDLPESGRRSAAAATVEAAVTAAAAAAAAVEETMAAPANPNKPQRKASASVRFRVTDETSASGEERSAKKCSRRRRCGPQPSTMDKSRVLVRAQQQQRGRCPRGKEMLRQANALQVERIGVADRARSPEAPAEGIRDRSPTFSGLGFVLVGLPSKTRREMEDAIVVGAGRVLEDMEPQPRERCARLLPDGAGAAAPPEAAARRRRKRSKRGAVSEEEEEEEEEEEGEEGNQVVVVVVVSVPTASRLPGYVHAIATGAPLLHHLWVSDSAAEARPLPAAPYLLPGAREASKRRQALAGAGGGGAEGTRRGRAQGTGCGLALAKVCTRTGTPLMGMAIAVAHPSMATCERWARVLSAAGAETVRRVSGELLLPDEGKEEARAAVMSSSPSKNTRSCRKTARASSSSSSSSRSFFIAKLAGLDCVLCDFPGAWSSLCRDDNDEGEDGGDTGGSGGGGAAGAAGAAG
ncbi:unnamed protein product, partial [Hapterophycus canaliculatus]